MLWERLLPNVTFQVQTHSSWFFSIIFLKRFYLFIFRERGREGEREGEKHQCVVLSHMPPTGDLACNPGMCPNWESNRWPFGSQAGTQSTEPHNSQDFLHNFLIIFCIPQARPYDQRIRYLRTIELSIPKHSCRGSTTFLPLLPFPSFFLFK